MFSARRTEADYRAWRDQRDGQPRNTAVSIGANGCRRIGGRLLLGPREKINPLYHLHCPLFLRLSIVCKQFEAHIQPGVGHFFEQAFMQALTSQLAARAGGAKPIEAPYTNIADRKASDRLRDMDVS